MDGRYRIRAARIDDLPGFVEYLGDHLRDNGTQGRPYFQPMGRDSPWPATEKLVQYAKGIDIPVGQPNWRRFWLAFDTMGAIAAHADLRARPEPHTAHRALLGMGVHRDHRRRGLGRALIDLLFAWAREHTQLEWIDLHVLGSNEAARRLYVRSGFHHVATVEDMFRVDGLRLADLAMTRRVRP